MCVYESDLSNYGCSPLHGLVCSLSASGSSEAVAFVASDDAGIFGLPSWHATTMFASLIDEPLA